MFEKVKINKKNNELHVTVTLKSSIKAGKKLKAHTRHIISLLNDRDIKFDQCIKENVLHNGSDSAKIGTWIFSLPTTKKTKPVIKTKKSKKLKEV